MTPESVQLVRVGSRDQRFAKLGGHFRSAPIWVEQSLVKMAELDRVKAIDLFEQAGSDRTAQHIKRMGRDGKDRHSAAATKLAQVLEILQPCHFRSGHVQQNRIRALQPHFGRRNEENPHRRCIRENLRAIEHCIVQRDGEDTEPELLRPLKQLMRRITNHILRIVESMDVKIDLEPVFVIDLAHNLPLSLDHDHEQEQEKSRTNRLRGIMLYLTFTAPASHPRELGWWNGRHVRLRGVCRKACGFKSRPEHQWKIRFSGAEVNSLLTPQPKARTELRKAAQGRARIPKAPRTESTRPYAMRLRIAFPTRPK